MADPSSARILEALLDDVQHAAPEVPSICKGGRPLLLGGEGGGIALPLGGRWEATLPQNAQVALYGCGLLYCFLGISVISDVFMSSIEKITSAKRKVNGKTKKVWNDTLANLTLMALGSSAPEILLSLIELIGGGMHSGDLGPSTIVGSAAFNLLIITGVVVSAIPSGEFRRIKDVSVFAVTASFSIFAYLWLLFIVRDNVVSISEGIITLGWFGVLLVMAYCADKGYVHRLCGLRKHPKDFGEDSSVEDLQLMLPELQAELERQVEQGTPVFIPDDLERQAALMKEHFSKPPSRAMRRLQTGVRAIKASNAMRRSVRDFGKKPLGKLDEEMGSIGRYLSSEEADIAVAKENGKARVLAVVEQNGKALKYAPDDLKKDKECVMAAVSQNGKALKYASDDLRSDKECVLKAVEQNGKALKHASMDLLGDREVVSVALENSRLRIKHASEDWRSGPTSVMAVVEQRVKKALHFSNIWRNSRDIVLVGNESSGHGLNHCSDVLRNDEGVVAAVGGKSDDLSDKCSVNAMSSGEAIHICPSACSVTIPDHIITNASEDSQTCEERGPPTPLFAVDGRAPTSLDTITGTITDASEAVIGGSGFSRGILAFEVDEFLVDAAPDDRWHAVVLRRKNGSTGTVSCLCRTEDISAVKGKDYGELHEELTFAPGQTEVEFKVLVMANTRFEKTESFRIILEEPSHPGLFDTSTDGGESQNILTVVITETKKHGWDHLMSTFNWDQYELGQLRWHEQVTDAVSMPEEAGVLEWILHVISVPWKLLCALVPPPDFCGGWLCFFSALVLIGVCTAVVGDMANLLGCALDIKAPLVAVTFVALGTSLPDTFASKTAAVQDRYADSSIGNITGSNSVNVFLGLGLPWLIGAIYWKIEGADDTNQANDLWYKRGALVKWPAEVFQHHPNGAFVVPAGSLVFTVAVFVGCAVSCIGILGLRRCLLGGELGGSKPTAYATSACLVMLWALYIGMNCWQLQVTEGGIMGF